MKDFLHPEKEIYNEALVALKNIDDPSHLGEVQRIGVTYSMDDKDVFYTVIFQSLFNAENNKFVEWEYLKTEMYIRPKG